MKTRTIVSLILLAATAAYAQAVYPPKLGSEYEFRLMQPCPNLDPDGIPIDAPALSVALEHAQTGALLACIEPVTCDVVQPVRVSVSQTGNRESYIGRAWSGAGCTDTPSDVSAETAYLYPGVKPKPVRLVEP